MGHGHTYVPMCLCPHVPPHPLLYRLPVQGPVYLDRPMAGQLAQDGRTTRLQRKYLPT